MSVNRVFIAGHAGKDPDIKMFGENKKATLCLATTRKGYTSKSGKIIPEQVEWHTIVCWGGLATYVEQAIRKGFFVWVEGEIHYSRFTDAKGNIRDTTEILADQINSLDKRAIEACGPKNTPEPAVGIEEPEDLPF